MEWKIKFYFFADDSYPDLRIENLGLDNRLGKMIMKRLNVGIQGKTRKLKANKRKTNNTCTKHKTQKHALASNKETKQQNKSKTKNPTQTIIHNNKNYRCARK